MWTIALKTLIADRGKMLTALVGVVFSIVLVNIQGGLFLGLIRKASLLVASGEADIWVGHKNMHNVDFGSAIPRRWLHTVRTVPGVKKAVPHSIGFAEMALPSGGFEQVTIVGVDRTSLLGGAWNLIAGEQHSILQTDGVILDACERDKLENSALGDIRAINGHRAQVVGMSQGITGFLVVPYVFTTFEQANTYLGKSNDSATYFLIQTDDNADPAQVCAAIKQRIPHVEAYTKEEYGARSINFWMTRTGLGISFGAATMLGLLVGMIMVAQTLYAMVLDRLPEFGTLKAIGATETQIITLLLVQACAMAIAGSIAGLSIVAAIQSAYSTPRAPILIPAWLSLGACAIVLTICLISSIIPYMRVRKVDPLMVLQP